MIELLCLLALIGYVYICLPAGEENPARIVYETRSGGTGVVKPKGDEPLLSTINRRVPAGGRYFLAHVNEIPTDAAAFESFPFDEAVKGLSNRRTVIVRVRGE